MSDGLDDVGAEMRAEWRAEQDAATSDAAAQWRASRKLTDWLEQRMHAGDRIAVNVAGARFAGTVEETSDDLIGIRTLFGRVDVHVAPGIPLYVELVDHVTEGGDRATASRSFRDALRERDGRDDLTVGVLHDPEGVDGVMFLGADFVSVVSKMGGETVLPLALVAWVAPRRA